MREGTLLVFAMLTLACGAERGEPASTPADPVVAPAPVAPAPSAPDCTSSVDCSFTTYPDVTTASDCACPSCEGPARSLARMSEIGERFERLCGEWLRAHACEVPICGARLALCMSGSCLAEPIAESGTGVPSPCRHPGECPGRAMCVVSALGGNLGCTNETCCGAAECGNGCATDADCPDCRPVCRDGGCRMRPVEPG